MNIEYENNNDEEKSLVQELSQQDIKHHIELLEQGEYDDHQVTINVASSIGVEIIAPESIGNLGEQIEKALKSASNQNQESKSLKVKDALPALQEEEIQNIIDEETLKSKTILAVEQNGIVFIDEIDKVIQSNEINNNISREGVQRDLLPLLEGATVMTKYGAIKTDHIL